MRLIVFCVQVLGRVSKPKVDVQGSVEESSRVTELRNKSGVIHRQLDDQNEK